MREYDNIKDQVKNLKTLTVYEFNLFIKQCYHILWSVEKTESKNPKVAKKNIGRLMLLLKCEVCDIEIWDWSKIRKLRGY